MKRMINAILFLVFIFSFGCLSLASPNTDGSYISTSDQLKLKLYCGLALPLDEGQGSEGGETDNTEEESQGGSESDSGSQTDDRANR